MNESCSNEFDLLIERIRQEAQQIDLTSPAVVPQAPANVTRLPAVKPVDIGPLFGGGIAYIDQFLAFGDEAFVTDAYRTLLGRAPDEQGHVECMQQLAMGLPRLSLLLAMRRSAEGRQVGVRIKGFSGLLVLEAVRRTLGKAGLRRLGEAPLRWLERRMKRRARQLYAVRQALETIQNGLIRGLNDWRLPLEVSVGQIAVHQRQLQAIRESLESTELPLRGKADSAPASLDSDLQRDLDDYYLAFENANRGSEAEIMAKLAGYEEVMRPLQAPQAGPLLDLGCGRGELLAWAAERGIRVEGVDTSPAMVEHCRQAGHSVYLDDALDHLRRLPEQSLGAVSGFHIIEHLPFHELFELMRECARVVRPGGFILFETPNPENILVGSHTFYHDFTHRNPVTPTAIEFLAQYFGFADIRILRSNPYPPQARVPGNDPLTERVNGHLCGPQDFAIVATRPQTGASQ
jgi:O-antigen chain-terminating methyltransferase